MKGYIKMTNMDVLLNTGWNITSQVVGTTDPSCRWIAKRFLRTNDLTKLN